jgi:flagellar hook-associated protein 2
MATLNFPGLATGIDTSKIIDQLMAVNSQRMANWQVKEQAMESKSALYDELKTKVSAFEKATAALADSQALETFRCSTSDSNRLGIAATNEANPGSHSVLINQLATSETWTQDTSTFDHDTDYVGAGTFLYSYNYQERAIATTSTTTLKDLVGLINNDEKNPGVTASLLNQGGKYHLMLSGRDTGRDYQISINSTSTEVWKPDAGQANATFTQDSEDATGDTKIVSLDQWSGPHAGTETITIAGKDHSGKTILPSRSLTIADDTTLDQLIKEINYFYDGEASATLVNGQIVVTDHTSGASGMEIGLTFNSNGSLATLGMPTMAVSAEGGATSASVASLAPSTFVQTQDAQNAQVRIDGYIPTKVAEVQTLATDAAATAGTFTLSFGGQTTDALAYNASISDIQTALNALSSVTAAGGLTVAGSTLNAGGPMTFTFASSAGDVSAVSINATGLTGPTSATVSETTRGNNEEWINRNSNIITDAVTGLTLILQGVNDKDTNGNVIPINVTVSRDSQAVKGKVDSMVAAYNTLLSYLKDKTEYNATTKKMGDLSDDIAVTLIKTQMKQPFIGVVSGFSSSDPYTQAKDIGLTFDGSGNLQLDATTFNNAIKDNYLDVVNLLGAAGTGNTDSTAIEFYNASSKFTTPGEYDVQATVGEQDGAKVITSAQIRNSGDSAWRNMVIQDNLLVGNSDFDSSGLKALYPENGLYLKVDLSSTGTFTSKVHVKKGMAGTLDTTMTDVAKSGGRLDVSKNNLQLQMTDLTRKISDEKTRLDKVQTALQQKFARLEKTLTQYQQQMSAVNAVTGTKVG